ncbi:Uncharacterized protein FWK35_00027437 [Aphis craccivora]|uniref:Uncharacterized protein n=1 Tax=Aphis craccivora TaxID=307492 RepID=A0A6G0VUV6_APHCR|nr:Uncharacterized protein FWK35_00025594 [Aphis craccivora]KAF0748442.1 Uncharacterized protein FWK35_00027437 [Aphis craccivora]
MTSLDDIKYYFLPETYFEEYWFAKLIDTQLLTNQKIYPRLSTSFSSPVMPQSMPMVITTFKMDGQQIKYDHHV